jgi:hypothetical protein
VRFSTRKRAFSRASFRRLSCAETVHGIARETRVAKALERVSERAFRDVGNASRRARFGAFSDAILRSFSSRFRARIRRRFARDFDAIPGVESCPESRTRNAVFDARFRTTTRRFVQPKTVSLRAFERTDSTPARRRSSARNDARNWVGIVHETTVETPSRACAKRRRDAHPTTRIRRVCGRRFDARRGPRTRRSRALGAALSVWFRAAEKRVRDSAERVSARCAQTSITMPS